mmetsp:Transcript_15889/g.25679  ORF Transcript_15889/g.25679 Transcript_15889/m.25679 type:complete len:207 (+) Transcript_15889:374-994(+)
MMSIRRRRQTAAAGRTIASSSALATSITTLSALGSSSRLASVVIMMSATVALAPTTAVAVIAGFTTLASQTRLLARLARMRHRMRCRGVSISIITVAIVTIMAIVAAIIDAIIVVIVTAIVTINASTISATSCLGRKKSPTATIIITNSWKRSRRHRNGRIGHESILCGKWRGYRWCGQSAIVIVASVGGYRRCCFVVARGGDCGC